LNPHGASVISVHCTFFAASDSTVVPPLAVFAVGGAGAQADLARRLLPSLKPLLMEGRLRLCLVAGVRKEVAVRFRAWLVEAGLEETPGGPVEILFEPVLERYFERFNELLAGTDLLWTKPSEMVFYGALGVAARAVAAGRSPGGLQPPLGGRERRRHRCLASTEVWRSTYSLS